LKNIALYEELSMNAHPAIKTQVFDGWFLRFANGYTNRANSINPIYPSKMAIDDKINFCEEIYKSQGLATVFKLTSLSFDVLDEILADKGYEKVIDCNVMIKSLVPVKQLKIKSIITDKITTEWQENFFRLNNISNDKIETAKIIQGNILNKTLCASIIENGVTVASGLCVVEREYAGLYDIVVDSRYRGQGLGSDICNSLLNAAIRIGAKTAYLQVVADNAPAIRLYNKLEFIDHYKYWFRKK